MKYLTPLITMFALLSPLAAEDLFSNSSMDTTAGWRGDKSFKAIDNNKVLVLKANPRKDVSFFQSADTKDLKDIILKFRYKTSDYKGRGFQMRGQRFDGSYTYLSTNLIADGQWHDCIWNFSEVRGSKSITFYLTLLDGTGSVYFDDVALRPNTGGQGTITNP